MKPVDTIPKWGPWWNALFYFLGVAAGWFSHLWS